ncbi:MAG: hypothetical protein HQ543_03135 [Bacteroidetes bacterium]|nr:hypothetical protein [Bacteroidota bacterium]
MREINYEAHYYQTVALTSRKKLIFLGCGVGAGKTDIGSLWILQKIKRQLPDQISLIAANTYTQLFDSTLRKIFQDWKKWGVSFYPREIPRSHHPFSLFVWNGNHEVEILCRSLEAYKQWSGQELAWVWLDEVWQTIKDAIDLALGRLRDNRNNMLLQILLTTTLDEPDTWMYEMFVDNYDSEIMDVVYGTTYDNIKHLPADYIDTLKRIYTKELFDRMVLAKWVSLTKGLIYGQFSRVKHMDPTVFLDPHLPLIWSWDFNIGEGKPMSSAIGQMKKGTFSYADDKGINKTITRPEIQWIDEIVVESTDTNDAIDEFENRDYLKLLDNDKYKVEIYGDATGRAHDTRSKTTDYGIIRDRGYKSQYVQRKNPPIRERHNTVNALLENALGDVRMKIHSRCKTILKGLEIGRLKSGALYLEEETFWQHVTTAIGYFACEKMPIHTRAFKQVQLGGF